MMMENMSYIRNKLLEPKLIGMLSTVDSVIKLLQAESDYRIERLITRRVRSSKLKTSPSLEDFDFTAKRSISRYQIEELFGLD